MEELAYKRTDTSIFIQLKKNTLNLKLIYKYKKNLKLSKCACPQGTSGANCELKDCNFLIFQNIKTFKI